MNRSVEYVRLAGDVRRLWEAMARLSHSLVELRQGKLASEFCDLELKLVELHEELTDLAAQPYRRPSCEYRPHGPSQGEIPF